MKDNYIEKLENLLIGVENFRFDVANVNEWKELTTHILKGVIAREKANQEVDKLANNIWSKLEGHYNPSYAEVEVLVNEKMKFTKENVVKVVDDYFRQADFESCTDLIAEIYNLDDTTEKVVVPKYIADFYEKRKYCILSVIFDEFKRSEEQKVVDWYIDGRSGGRHVNGLANSQETITKMYLYGYTIEPE